MSDQDAALQVMNQARAEAPGGDRPALIWDDGLAQGAQDWANTMAATQNFEHSGAEGLGENISAFFGDVSGGELQNSAQGWLDEKSKYHGEKSDEAGSDGNYEAWGHYTQCIWPSTTNFGMAQATASNGSIYVCGRFSPPGNFGGQSATNGMDPNTSFHPENPGTGAAPGGTYTVQPGDSMFLIAQKLGMTLQAFEALNPLVKPPAFQINVGDVLNTSAGSPGSGLSSGPAPGGTYTVQPGDSMFAISQKFGVTLQALEAVNPQVKGPAFQINVGDVLRIPGSGSPGPGSSNGPIPSGTYTVQPGDSMFAISQKLGITLQALETANPQVKAPAFQINVGDILQIPGKGPGTGPSPGGPSSGGNSGTYVVQPGDSMFAISQKIGITLQALETANPQVKPPAFQINVGDVLQIQGKGPSTGPSPGGPTSGGTYTVQPGDSLFAISQKLGITLQALEAANPQVKPPAFQINVGDVLQIPGKGPSTGPSPGGPTSGGTYTVQPGDSLFSISQKLGMSLQALEALNPQVKPPVFQINVGDVLQISGGKGGGTGNGKGGNHSYTVAAGDSMFSIATAHGVSLAALEAANPQVKPPQFQINVGQVITIP